MENTTTPRAHAAKLLRIAAKYLSNNECDEVIDVDGIETDAIGLSMDLENAASALEERVIKASPIEEPREFDEEIETREPSDEENWGSPIENQ